MTHASEQDLALFAGGDLGWTRRWRIVRHLHRCVYCQSALAGFRSSASTLRSEANQLPAGLHWDDLSAEMTANIRLGVDAGRCVARAEAARPAVLRWKPAAVLASATALVVTAWWVNIQPVRRHVAAERARVADSAIVQTTPGGIEVKSAKGALTLLRPRASSQTVLYVSSPGSLRERFVDEETGQVTINNVYTE